MPSLGNARDFFIDDAPPAQIGRFAVLGKLGEGGMGVVFLGRDAELERNVAIKLIRSNAAASIGVRRLVREAQGLARLSHPHVIQVHEIGEHHGSMFVAMEYVDGCTLRDWIDADDRPWQQTLEVLRQSGRGLEAAHLAGLVHRDFKPGNVMVGHDGRARVLDFGLARDWTIACAPEDSSPALEIPSQAVDDDRGETHVDSGPGGGASLTRTGSLVGTPAYMATEQLRGEPGDPLSDQFSFCVTAYEALFGRRPFVGATLAELAANVVGGVPAPIPDPCSVPERAQQAVLRGLHSDRNLRWPSMAALLDELDAVIAMTEIQAYLERIRETKDQPAKFRVSERSYGREQQLAGLEAAFERARSDTSRTQLLLVSGLAGVGKSSLVAGLQPIVKARAGWMISGRFDQRGATPLAGISEAFCDLVTQAQSLDVASQARLRQELVAAAGRNARLLTDLVPELARVLGEQAPLPELAGPERLNRLHLVVESFVSTLASPERPLVLFIDDLQWADPASLALLEHLLSSPTVGSVLVVGAYRTNEVGPEHPLRDAVERLRAAGAPVASVEVEALSRRDVEALLADTLGMDPGADDRTPNPDPASLRELAELALSKTQGNPFYLRQLLRTMYDEGVFAYDGELETWSWDLGRIAASAALGDIDEVLLRNLETLPAASLRLAQIAACVGPRVDLRTLAAVADRYSVDVFSDLWPCFEQGLLLIGGDSLDTFALAGRASLEASAVEVTVSFRHARIQQAAASSLSDADRLQLHVKIGRALRRRIDGDALGPRAFALADHLNTARSLLDDQERSSLVDLNIVCGRQALDSAAFASAIDYLAVAAELLTPDAATTQHERWFNVEIERGRALSLDGRYADAHTCYDRLVDHTQTVAERLQVNTAQVEHALLVADFEGGYAACRNAFALHGVALPKRDEDAHAMLVAELAALDDNLGARPLASLCSLPEFDDDQVQPILGLLHGLGAIGYFSGRRNLYAWATARMTNIFVCSGNSKMSSVAYARMALHLAERGEYERAYAFGEVAISLCDRYDDPSVTGRALIVYLGHAAYYNHPLRELLPRFEAAFIKCLEGGDLLYAGHHLLFPQLFRLVAGVPLPEILAKIESHLPFLRRSVPSLLSSFYVPHIAFVTCTLMDVPLARIGLSFDHDAHIERFGRSMFAMGWYYPALTKVEYLLGQRPEPVEIIRRISMFETCLPGNLQVREIRYYAGLSLLDSQRALALPLIAAWRSDLARCAARCPANFLHKHLLLEAECMQVAGGPLEQVIGLYERAIDEAHEQRALDQEALACWRFAEFWRARGSKRTAIAYLHGARELYQAWGAARLVRALDELL